MLSSRCVISSSVRPRAASMSSLVSARAAGTSRCSPGSSRISSGNCASRPAGEREAAALAGGDAPPLLPHLRGEPVGQPPNPLEQAHPLEHVEQLGVAGVPAGQAEVLLDRRVEHVRVLRHEPHDTPDLLGRQIVDLDAVERDRPAVGQESYERPRERRLARPAGPDQPDPRPRLQVEVHARQGPARLRRGGERAGRGSAGSPGRRRAPADGRARPPGAGPRAPRTTVRWSGVRPAATASRSAAG